MLDVLSSERDIHQKKISLYNSQYKSIETSVLFRTRLERKMFINILLLFISVFVFLYDFITFPFYWLVQQPYRKK